MPEHPSTRIPRERKEEIREPRADKTATFLDLIQLGPETTMSAEECDNTPQTALLSQHNPIRIRFYDRNITLIIQVADYREYQRPSENKMQDILCCAFTKDGKKMLVNIKSSPNS